jgi:hypothetical protein
VRTFHIARRIVALLIVHVGEDSVTQFAFFQPDRKLRQISWEGLHVRVVILGVFPQILTAQFAS